MRIAIASSGLGHIARGIETWALDTANALHQRGVDVTLFSAGEVTSSCPIEVIPCIRRRTPASNLLVSLTPGFAWRWGLKNGYGWEQYTFWRHLRNKLKEGNYDILHIQDPMIAWWCRRARTAGRIRTKEILAHGTEEPIKFLSQFDYVQHLAPWHLEQTLSGLKKDGVNKENWTVAPNFVNTDHFIPVKNNEEKCRLRSKLGIPEDAFVIGTAAAIKKEHKRIDYLIREFAQFIDNQKPRTKDEERRAKSEERRSTTFVGAKTVERESGKRRTKNKEPGTSPKVTNQEPFLVIAGAHEDETDEIIAFANMRAPGHVLFLEDFPFSQMPVFYRCLDLFVLGSLFEMMGIVLIEAMSTAVPVIVHNHPVLKHVVFDTPADGNIQPGGYCINMEKSGVLTDMLSQINNENIKTIGKAARKRTVTLFSKEFVIEKYIEYYKQITSL